MVRNSGDIYHIPAIRDYRLQPSYNRVFSYLGENAPGVDQQGHQGDLPRYDRSGACSAWMVGSASLPCTCTFRSFLTSCEPWSKPLTRA